MRSTSIAAYITITENGLLTKARLIVYKILFEHGPLTAGEIFEIGQKLGRGHLIVKGSICARLTELCDQGVVSEVGERVWDATGHNNTLWDVTAHIPVPLVKKKTKDQLIKELLEENRKLKATVDAILSKQTRQLTFL